MLRELRLEPRPRPFNLLHAQTSVQPSHSTQPTQLTSPVPNQPLPTRALQILNSVQKRTDHSSGNFVALNSEILSV